MSDFKIKAESLLTRCEICHQSDCFDAESNYCSRCEEVANDIPLYKRVRKFSTIITSFAKGNLKIRAFILNHKFITVLCLIAAISIPSLLIDNPVKSWLFPLQQFTVQRRTPSMSAINNGADRTQEVSPEEYEVYSALINKMYIRERIKLAVIENETDCWVNPFEEKPKDERLRLMITKAFPTISKDIVDDFSNKNIRSYSLKKDFSLQTNYVLVSNKEIEEIFKGNGWWDSFYNKFPNSTGIIQVSRVGFNKELTKCLVNVNHSCGGLCGDGNFVVLEKKDGVWLIKSEVRTWVS